MLAAGMISDLSTRTTAVDLKEEYFFFFFSFFSSPSSFHAL
jgi:hypothetical protein